MTKIVECDVQSLSEDLQVIDKADNLFEDLTNDAVDELDNINCEDFEMIKGSAIFHHAHASHSFN